MLKQATRQRQKKIETKTAQQPRRIAKKTKKVTKVSKRSMAGCPFKAIMESPAPAPMTAEEIAIVKSCVPLLEAGGEALTTHFYNNMIGSESVVRPFFNPAHQAEKSQPRALAYSVLCVAKNAENLGAIAGTKLVDTIVKKHLAVQVMPEHYPIVGKYLLSSIRTVLGPEIATDQVISAWAKCYGVLADLLIRTEAAGYAELNELPGGWAGQRPFTVISKEFANGEKTAISYTVKASDGKLALIPEPGQYLTLRIKDPKHGIDTTRNYSISDVVEGQGNNTYRFTTQVVDGGVVTNYLKNHIQADSVLNLHPPTGEFILRKKALTGDAPVTFIAAGAGITPFIPMIKNLREKNPQQAISLLTVNDNPTRQILVDEIDSLPNVKVAKMFALKEDVADELSEPTQNFLKFLKDNKVDQTPPANIYIVGPGGFMKTAHNALTKNLGVKGEEINYEFFGPHVFF